MENLKAKYFKGWIHSEILETAGPTILNIWLQAARKAEQENCELVIFKIPRDKDGTTNATTISTIETLLQDWFDKSIFDQ